MDKITRLLLLYSKLTKGEKINKTIFCLENDCSPRTFDRDIEDVRLHLSLQVAIRKGIISFIPKTTPAGVIDNIAYVGIENVKILAKIALGDLSVTKGLDQMGRVTTSMAGGLLGITKGAAFGASLTGWISVVGLPLGVVTGFIGGIVGYFGGSKLGEIVYNTAKAVVKAATTVGKAAWNGIKAVGKTAVSAVKSVARGVASFFGL